MKQDYRELVSMIDKAAEQVQRGEARSVIVTCPGGGVLRGEWIEHFSRSYNYAPSVLLFAEADDGALIETRIEADQIAAVGVELAPNGAVNDGTRITVGRRTMTLAAILIELWGRTEEVTFGMMLDALQEVDGSGEEKIRQYAPKYLDTPLDHVGEENFHAAEKVLLHLAQHDMPDQVLDMPILDIKKNAITDDLRRHLAALEQAEAIADLRVRNLPNAIRGEVACRLRLFLAREHADRAWQPYIERGRWKSRLLGR